MKATIDRVAESIPLVVTVVDISGNAELESLYGLEIPVLMVEGKKAAKYRASVSELTRILVARSQLASDE
jgi:hypothetical protein